MIFPSEPRFRRWAGKFSVIPFFIRLSGKGKDPFSCFAGSSGDFFLDSCHSGGQSRYSFFPLSAPSRIFTARTLKEFPGAWRSLEDFFERVSSPGLPKGFPPFFGGAAGVISYDAGRFFEPGWKTPPPPDPLKFPFLHFGIYNDLVAFDHHKKDAWIISCLAVKKGQSLEKAYRAQVRKIEGLAERFCAVKNKIPEPPKHSKEFRPAEKEWFTSSVRRIQGYIEAGDIYQANLSQRMEAGTNGDPLDFYGRLRAVNPSPYSCFFRLPKFDVASSSPELLLRKRGDLIETRPIAGTRPRGADKKSDRRLEGELLLNKKEQAEHVMLLDLERNDLGRVCRAGSVRVTEKMSVERYSHVMHIVSHVKGRLKPGEDIFSALPAAFPGGTITGCPKVRCMEILDEIEPVSRGPFFGSAGWIGYNRDAEFNLLIRTAVFSRDKVFVQAGSGIVADSVPDAEYEESLHKARALRHALAHAL